MSTHSKEYIMGRTSEEYQRLRLQAKVWETATQRVLQQAGLGEGMQCLDIGCGPGEVMRLMGDSVGPKGHVTGIDVDGKLGNEALGVLQATTENQFAFIETDVEATDDIPGAPFDLTFARFTLIHLKDQIAALRKMLHWTKPGGVVVIQEYESRTWDVYPAHAAFAELQQIFCTVMEKAGRDLYLGTKLQTRFVEAGLGRPDGTDVVGALVGFDVGAGMGQDAYNSVFPVAQKMGLTDESKRQTIFATIDETIQAGTHTILSPLLISAWKRKPLR